MRDKIKADLVRLLGLTSNIEVDYAEFYPEKQKVDRDRKEEDLLWETSLENSLINKDPVQYEKK